MYAKVHIQAIQAGNMRKKLGVQSSLKQTSRGHLHILAMYDLMFCCTLYVRMYTQEKVQYRHVYVLPATYTRTLSLEVFHITSGTGTTPPVALPSRCP